MVRAIRRRARGIPAVVPYWVDVLEMADGDPLRAMEIETGVSARWYGRAQVWREAIAEAQYEASKK